MTHVRAETWGHRRAVQSEFPRLLSTASVVYSAAFLTWAWYCGSPLGVVGRRLPGKLRGPGLEAKPPRHEHPPRVRERAAILVPGSPYLGALRLTLTVVAGRRPPRVSVAKRPEDGVALREF